jgi:enoyl-CoA hydratase/carnithine racemase
VNGVCLGGGVGLALACDIAIARAGVRIGTPEVRVGVFPMIIAPLVLRHVPRRRAIEMMFTGEIVTSEEAAAIGLVTRTVPPADLDVAVRASLDALFAASPSSIRLGRQALADVEGLPVREAIGRLPEWLMKVLATDDAAEGISAFMEKRAPLWKHPR